MAELTIALKETSNEIDNHKVANQALANTNLHLRTQLEKQREEIEQLQADNKEHEKSVDSYESKINEQHQEIVTQQEKFNQAGNPDYEAVLKLENEMRKKLEKVGNVIKESLLQQVRENNKKMEEKLNQVITENKSYADTLKKNLSERHNQSNAGCSDFRSIIKENKNDELITERERQLRATNIIIHGVGEEIENGKEKDEEFVTAFLGKLGIESKSSLNVRLGNFDPNKTRPLKLKMSSEAEKENIMSRLPNLKNAEDRFRKVSVTEDYTVEERKEIKKYVEKAKEQNRNETRGIIWKVHGTPKNGLEIKQFPKRHQQAN